MRIVVTNSCENCPHFRDGSIVGVNNTCSFDGDGNLKSLPNSDEIPNWCPMPTTDEVSCWKEDRWGRYFWERNGL